MTEKESTHIYGNKWLKIHNRLGDIFPEPLCYLSASGRILLYNSVFLKVFGEKWAGVVGKNIAELGIPRELLDPLVRVKEGTKNVGQVFQEFFLPVQGDALHLFEAVFVPLASEGGLMKSCLLIFRDITESQESNSSSLRGLSPAPPYAEIFDAVFILDWQGNLLYGNRVLENICGIKSSDLLGQSFQSLIYTEDQGQFSKLLQEALAGRKACGEIRFASGSDAERWVNLILSPLAYASEKPVGVQAIVTDITEKKRMALQVEELLTKLQKSMKETVQAMSALVAARDPYTAGHQQRVAGLAEAIAEELGLREGRKQQVGLAGLVHDLGKISIPAEILNKPASLSEAEMSIVRLHPEIGYRVLKEIELLNPISEIVLEHHERLDGSGYCQGLKGSELSLEGKILAVADVVEAMSSYRPYRPALGVERALEEINQNKGRLYDPIVVDACMRVFQRGSINFR